MAVRHLFFIDTRLADWPALIAGLPADSVWFAIRPEEDGLGQMTCQGGAESIHIPSHGSPGRLVIGASMLDSDTLGDFGGQLAQIGSSLGEGCELAKATGANVAASTNATGASTPGADWLPEYAAETVIAQAVILPETAY